MRAKHWIAVVLFVAIVASAQAYALTMDKEPKVAPQAAEVQAPESAAGPKQVVSQESPTEVEPADEQVAESPTSDPRGRDTLDPVDDVETLIVGFQKALGAKLMEAIVRAGGATPQDTVSAPGTLVVSVDNAESEAVIAQLEKHLLVDYVAVPKRLPNVTSSS